MVRILRPEHWRDHHLSVQQVDGDGGVLLPIVDVLRSAG